MSSRPNRSSHPWKETLTLFTHRRSSICLATKDRRRFTMESEGKAEVPVEEIAAGKVEIDTSIVKFEKQKKTITFREFVPNVIEPSFGIGRILYSLMEHSYWTRENDEARSVLSFSPVVAPIKVLVCPLQKDPKFTPLIAKLEEALDNKSISFKIDQTGVSIGKRYSRNDELGIPFGITPQHLRLLAGPAKSD
ncbi:hypothetical protein E1952_14925 [Staphylococcus aureus]|nr:hypothetical protein E1952_14925 [Staphylococcus aureus]